MEINSIIENAANKCGFKRVKFQEKNMPFSMDDVCILPLFSDLKSISVISMLLAKRYREESKGSKYFILCSWGEFSHLFPYVDEFWQVNESVKEELISNQYGIVNDSKRAIELERNLNYFFSDVVSAKELLSYYNNGIQENFFQRYKKIKVYKPSISSPSILGMDFIRNMTNETRQKIFLYPVKNIYQVKPNRTEKVFVEKKFWTSLTRKLIDGGYLPIIYRDNLCYDLSLNRDLNAIHLADLSLDHLFAAMRSVNCVLDVFSGISRLALISRTSFLAIDERKRYNKLKEYEIDDLCGQNLIHDYIWSFVSILRENDTMWENTLFNLIINKLNKMLPIKDSLVLSALEVENVALYENVRKREYLKLGAKYIKTPKNRER